MFDTMELSIVKGFTDDSMGVIILFHPQFCISNSFCLLGCIARNIDFILGTVLVYTMLGERFSERGDSGWFRLRSNDVFPEALAK
jgi:hypothetical protein